jgi:hypothetical protein
MSEQIEPGDGWRLLSSVWRGWGLFTRKEMKR